MMPTAMYMALKMIQSPCSSEPLSEITAASAPAFPVSSAAAFAEALDPEFPAALAVLALSSASASPAP